MEVQKDSRTSEQYKSFDNYERQQENDRMSEDFNFMNSQMLSSLNEGKRIIAEILKDYELDKTSSYITEEVMTKIEEVVEDLASHFVNLYNKRNSPEFIDFSSSEKKEYFKQKILDKVFVDDEDVSNSIISSIIKIDETFNKERLSRDLLKKLDLI